MDFTPTYLDVGFDELVNVIDLAPTLLRVGRLRGSFDDAGLRPSGAGAT